MTGSGGPGRALGPRPGPPPHPSVGEPSEYESESESEYESEEGEPMTDVERVGIVGCGLMGSGIAEVCARAGRDVVVVETSRSAADAGRERIVRSLARATAAGKLTEAERDAAVGRIAMTTDMDRMTDRDLVVEAVAEDERAKLEVSPGSTGPSGAGTRSSRRTPPPSR